MTGRFYQTIYIFKIWFCQEKSGIPINIAGLVVYLLTYPSEKYEFVSWEYDIPNIWKVIKFMFQTTNQPLLINPYYITIT